MMPFMNLYPAEYHVLFLISAVLSVKSYSLKDIDLLFL